MARVYAVASAKGGVGKTTTTANLGTVLSMAGHDVVVVDGDLGMPNLAGALGVDPDGKTLHDVLTGEATVEAATYDGPGGLSVVPGSTALEAFASANAKQLHPVVETLKERHDIVLIDTGAGLSDDTFVPLKLADEVLLVSTTEREALGDTEKTRQLGERIGADVVGVVLTRVNQSNPNADEVATRLDAGVIAVVPEDAAIREALSTQVPVVARSPDSIAAAGYRALAEALTGEPVPLPDRVDDAGHGDDGDGPDEPGAGDADADADADSTDPDTTDADADADVDAEVDATDPDTTDAEVTVIETDESPASEPSESQAETDVDSIPDSDAEPEASSPVAPETDETGDGQPDVASAGDDADTTPDSTVEQTLEAEADAMLDAEEESLDGAIPFGGDPSGSADDDPLAGDSAADDVAEDPVTADLDDTEPADAASDPLAGDAVTDAPSDEDAAAGAEDSDEGDADVTRSVNEADDGGEPTSDATANDESAGDAAAVVGTAPSGADDEPLVAEAEPDRAAAQSSADADGDGDEEGVYTTSLVEEVESLEDDEEDEKKGFLSRFLG